MAEGRVLFLFERDASFVAADRAILQDRFDVDAMECSGGTTLPGVLRRLRAADVSFSWFALGYAARAVLLGRWFRRPSVVVSGGWDVVSMPEIQYGAARSPRGRRRARYVLRRATKVLAISEWSRQRIEELGGRDAECLYPGIDLERFRPHGEREDLVVTVGNVTEENLARKGLGTFVRAAASLPGVRFVLVGRHIGSAADTLRRSAPPNVSLPGWLPDEELRDLLARAKVYVQVSYNEGFGVALAEAMASGCVPVVTRAGALPEVAGDVGFYAPFGDAAATADSIRQALAGNRSSAARARIAERFPLSRRRERLLGIVGGLLRG